MADLLTDPAAVKESWRQMAINDPVVAPAEPKTIDPNAKLKLAARDQAADPFSGLQEVKSADPFAGLQEVKPNDPFAGLKPADALDVKDVPSLVADDTFRPADYLASNPDLRKDAAKSKKLIDVYRARQERGLEAGKVLKAAATEAPGIIAKTAKGARDLAARAIELGVQPAATSILSALTGASPEEKAAIMAEQGKEQLKAAGEVTAGTESAITGLAQLGQQGARKVQHLFGKPVSKMSDSDLLDQLYLDSEFSKTTKEVAEGKGDVVKAAGLDADTLAKNGVTLDKDAIENLSLVDPLTLVATAGAFKVVGLGGKVIATAATRAGAQSVITGLAKVAQTVGAKGVEALGKTAEAVGKAGQSIAERIPAKSIGFVLGATKGGSLHGGAIGAAAGEAAKRIGYETAGALSKQGARISELGSQLNPSFIGPRSGGLQRVLSLPSTAAGQVATSAVKGAVQGAVTAVPLAAAADESQTAGALLGGGAALGAIHGTVTGGKAAVAETVAKNYLDPHNIPFEPTNSPAYGVDAALDKSHEAAIAKLPESEQNAVNNFREAVRAGGGEIYVQDSNEYLNRIRENIQNENGGKPLTPEQESQAKLYSDTHAFFDGDVSGRRVVFLNSDAKGLPHDAGHLFQSLLSPENQAALRESALSSYSPEQLQAFKDEYARRIGEPDYFNKLGDEANNKAADELIAENFGQLFQNKTFSDLSAPRPFLKKLGDTAVKAGEALGFDLTAGRVTPDLGAKPSFRLQDLLRNAAQDVLTREPKTPAPEKAPLKLRPEDVARREANVPVTKEVVEPAKPAEPVAVTPEAVVPKSTPEVPSSTAKNIRTERAEQSDFASRRAEETGIAEAQKATESTPEVRKVVDDIAASMNAGNPVLEVEHRGIVSERGPGNPEGRTSRRGTQEAGYQELERLQIENRAEAPADIVDLHQKTFVPVRFTTQGGKPTLIAMSLDKVIANVRRVVKDAVANGAEKLLPYPVENGKLTDAGWKQAVEDVKSYAENQSNGYRGDGQKLVRPTEDIGVSIPAENPNYTPKTISEGAMNFANLVQGLNPPETGRVQKGLTPGNVKGQLLAEVNKKQPLTPAVITPENVTKQSFKGFEPRTVKETNPLRNELAARGVKVRDLTEVTERLAVQDIASVKPRPDINFKAPVTDVIRAGFLPKDRPVAETISSVEKASPDEWSKSFGPQNSLTREAFEVGLKLKSPDELTALRDAQSRASDAFKSAMEKFKAGDESAMAEAYAQGSKGQFFREAYEAATDTGSAAGSYGWRKAFPEGKPPFAAGKEGAKFLPRTEAGKKAAENGIELRLTGGIGNRTLRILKNGEQVGDVSSSSNSFTGDLTKVTIGGVFVEKNLRGQGIGEAAYRELLTQLKEDGVKEISGMTVSGAPLAIREKVFGKGSTKVTDVGGSDRGTIPVDQAISELNDGGLGFEAKNEITSNAKFLPSDEKAITGQAFKDFFSKASKGEFGKSEVPWVPLTDISSVKDFSSAVQKHSGNFDEHIAKSIPAYRETQFKKGQALVNMSEGAEEPLRVLDIGGSEGSWDKAVSEQSGGKVHTTVVDPNPTMADFFRTKSKVPGADYAEAAWVRGFEDEGKQVPKFDTTEKFDAINESMVFQFMSPERAEQVAEAKRLLKPDGLFLTDEKLRTDPKDWAANEAKKDAEFKKVYFSADELKAKDKVVGFQQSKSESKAVGMVDNMVTTTDFEKTLKENFKHVAQYWDSGNFKGYVASDSLPKLQEFLREVGDTKSAFSTTETPRYVDESPKFLPKPLENLRETIADLADELGTSVTDILETLKGSPVKSGMERQLESNKARAQVLKSDESPKLLPKKRNVKVSDVQKRDDQNRPLTGEGLVDYEKLYAEKTKKDKAQEVADLASIGDKYQTPDEYTPSGKQNTGWVLPDGNFVPIDAAYHQDWLAKNADQLNKDFKTNFSNTASVEERLSALNSGFVRVRDNRGANTVVELNSKFWKGDTKAKVEDLLLNGTLPDRFTVTLLDDRGNVVDSTHARLFDSENPAGDAADALSQLKGATTEKPKGVGPTDIQRARAFGQTREPQFLPRKNKGYDAGEYWISKSGNLESAPEGHEQWVVDKYGGEHSGGHEDRTSERFSNYGLAEKDGFSRVVISPTRIFVDSGEKFSSWDSLPRSVKGQLRDLSIEKDIPVFFDSKEVFSPEPREGGSAFLPKGGTPEFNDYVAARIRDNKQHPEALPLDFRKDEAGNYVAGFNGEPTPIVREYELLNTPLAKKSKGKTIAETEEKFTDELAKGLEKEYAKAKKNPEIEAGETWYSTTRKSLSKLLGDDTKLFAELLGATSPQTAVGVNFGFALEAYNQFKKGAYDKMLEKYREGKQAFAAGELDEFSKETGKTGKKATYDAFMGWWLDKHELIPTQSNGKRFGMNSKAVLRVLDGSWLQNVKGPKTPNFTGNLTGSTFEATIDVWAMRTLHRLANEGNPKRWRIQPGNETGVTDTDFFLGQKAFRKAAEKLGIKPDALQAILWFNEKDHWTKKGWTSAIGKAKADFNSLLKETERTPGGILKRTNPQLDFTLNESDVTPKK